MGEFEAGGQAVTAALGGEGFGEGGDVGQAAAQAAFEATFWEFAIDGDDIVFFGEHGVEEVGNALEVMFVNGEFLQVFQCDYRGKALGEIVFKQAFHGAAPQAEGGQGAIHKIVANDFS